MFKKIKNLQKLNFLKLFKLELIEKQLIIILSVAVFFVTNFLISFISYRIDLSNGKAYTLSSSTKKIIRNLDDIVNIKFYVSSDLPTRLLSLKTDVTDFLNEYKKEGRGKVAITIVDPKKDERSANEVKEIGIPELQFSQLEADKYAVSAVYFGVAISYGQKTEIIAQATDLGSLEYNLSAAIYKLVNKKLVKLGYLGVEEAADFNQDSLLSLKKVLSQQYEIEPVNLSGEEEEINISNDLKTVMVFDDAEKEYSQKEIDAFQRYLDQKGKLIFFVDGIWVMDSLQTAEAKHNLFNLIKSWGVEINKNLLLSSSSELVNFGNEMVQFFSPYPFWVRSDNFNNQLGYFSNINQLTFPWVSSLSISKKDGLETVEVVKTTNKSWEEKEISVGGLSPENITQPEAKDLKEFIIAAQSKKKDKGEIVVIPSSRFIQEKYLTRSSNNLEFVLNLLNDLASDGALSGIRQRAVSSYPLPDLSDNQKDIFKYVNILLLPALFIVYGGLRLMKRK